MHDLSSHWRDSKWWMASGWLTWARLTLCYKWIKSTQFRGYKIIHSHQCIFISSRNNKKRPRKKTVSLLDSTNVSWVPTMCWCGCAHSWEKTSSHGFTVLARRHPLTEFLGPDGHHFHQLISTKGHIKIHRPHPCWCGSVGWSIVPFWWLKGCGFDSRSGHIPRLWVWFQVQMHTGSNQLMLPFSWMFPSFPSSLSL